MKRSRGLVGVESFKGRLRIRLPRECFAGKQKYLSLGLSDTDQNHVIADLKSKAIQTDIDLGRFDQSLESYKQGNKKKVTTDAIKKEDITLLELWDKYIHYLTPIRKYSTIVYLQSIRKLLKRSNIICPQNYLSLRQWLTQNTSESYTKRTLQQMNACYKWGLKHDLVCLSNPYVESANEFKHPYERSQNPLAFTEYEQSLILEVFKNHQRNVNNYGLCGYSFSYYFPLVHFLFLTGCRPSEAIGLKWCDIDKTFDTITFDGGIQTLNNGEVYSTKGKGSKNNRKRIFPCNSDLKELLFELSTTKQSDLLFPSRANKEKPIIYNNFSRTAWKKLVNPIRQGTTPYNCRDTFICSQIKAGIPIAVISKWVDSSVQTIEKYYLDMVVSRNILPK